MDTARETIQRTLVIRFSSVGDVVLSSLLLRVLRRRFPMSQIDYVIKSEFADLVRHNPNVSSVIEFPTTGTFGDLVKLWRRIRRENYDLIVDIHGSVRSRFLCLGASRAVRYRKRKIARFFLVKLKWNLYRFFGGAPSVAERYVEAVKEFGVENDGSGLELFFPDDVGRSIERSLRTHGLSKQQAVIGICPSAKHNNKMWLKEGFAETAVSLARKHSAAIAILGSNGDVGRNSEIEVMMKKTHPNINVMNLTARLSLLETAAFMDRCSIIVSNDSGLMHVAAARKRKIVAIFGPTVKELGFFPYAAPAVVIEHRGLNCRPCTHIGLPECPRGHFKCMNEISPSEVVDAANLLLRNQTT